MKIGYTMMCEQSGPKEMVRDVAMAEEAGFDYAVISDLALVQVGGDQQPDFIKWAGEELLPEARQL